MIFSNTVFATLFGLGFYLQLQRGSGKPGFEARYRRRLGWLADPGTAELSASGSQVPEGSQVFAFTSHTHRLGTGFTIERSTDFEVPGTLLYENSDWEHPPLQQYDDDHILSFAPGEGLRWLGDKKGDAVLTGVGDAIERSHLEAMRRFYLDTCARIAPITAAPPDSGPQRPTPTSTTIDR